MSSLTSHCKAQTLGIKTDLFVITSLTDLASPASEVIVGWIGEYIKNPGDLI